jgi:threonine dehydratase
VVIVREAELRETLVRLALEEHLIAEGAGALALAAGRRVAGRRKCAVVSGGNLDAGVLARCCPTCARVRRASRAARRSDLAAGSEPALAAGPRAASRPPPVPRKDRAQRYDPPPPSTKTRGTPLT